MQAHNQHAKRTFPLWPELQTNILGAADDKSCPLVMASHALSVMWPALCQSRKTQFAFRSCLSLILPSLFYQWGPFLPSHQVQGHLNGHYLGPNNLL